MRFACHPLACALLAPSLAVAMVTVPAMAAQTELVSVKSDGTPGNDGSSICVPSGDGWFIVFTSGASDLAPKDGNANLDVFRHERSGSTVLVGALRNGWSANGQSSFSRISRDGRYVAFLSGATKLVSPPLPTGVNAQLFRRDLKTGKVKLISQKLGGGPADDDLQILSISGDGRFVLFSTVDGGLVKDDNNRSIDVFLYDAKGGATVRASVASGGKQGVEGSFDGAMSDNARYVAFGSQASNFAPNDSNGVSDVFVHDRPQHVTTRVSVSSTGEQGDDFSTRPAISDNGRYVAFMSRASNLADGDTDGAVDLFLHDRRSGKTTNLTPGDATVNSSQHVPSPSMSGDGRYIAFATEHALVPGDTNGASDIYLVDRAGAFEWISIGLGGEATDNGAGNGVVSADGLTVAFSSDASNLVTGPRSPGENCFLRVR
jgi:Tol biopolymer transport system component